MSIFPPAQQVEEDPEAEARWSGWTLEDGYLGSEVGTSATSSSELGESRPLRALAPGLHMGLSVMVDVKEEEYYCSGTESVGFKVGKTTIVF